MRRSLSRADFDSLRSGGRRLSGRFFSLQSAPLPEGTRSSKFSCVVSKKVAAKAVARNLIKRRCRALVHPLLKTLVRPSALAFHAKREAAKASFAEMREDVIALFARLA